MSGQPMRERWGLSDGMYCTHSCSLYKLIETRQASEAQQQQRRTPSTLSVDVSIGSPDLFNLIIAQRVGSSEGHGEYDALQGPAGHACL